MRERRQGGEGRGRGIQGAEKLKGFFYLLLNQLSTMQEIIRGDKKKKAGGADGALERKGRREEGREVEGKRGGG